MGGFATCDDCGKAMNPRGGCKPTHVGKGPNGPWVRRVRVGEGDDWSAPMCHDCNAGTGKVHHSGCDAERCPECGGQMLGCFGDDEFAEGLAELTGQVPCKWTYMCTNPPAAESGERIVKVVWKDEGDFGFITTLTAADLATREAGSLGVPFDPSRERPYGSRADAQALAREHGATYEEV